MSKLPDDLIEISSYNGRHGNIDLKGLMYSPSEKALYNKGFLNKKINLNNKRNFYSYVKSENPLERKRICINLSRFLAQYPQYKNINENSKNSANAKKDEKNNFNENSKNSANEKNGDKSKTNESVEISIEYDEHSDGNEASPAVSENQFIDILNNYKD